MVIMARRCSKAAGLVVLIAFCVASKRRRRLGLEAEGENEDEDWMVAA